MPRRGAPRLSWRRRARRLHDHVVIGYRSIRRTIFDSAVRAHVGVGAVVAPRGLTLLPRSARSTGAAICVAVEVRFRHAISIIVVVDGGDPVLGVREALHEPCEKP